jgi:nucleoside-diphosphate-sugar epimerase
MASRVLIVGDNSFVGRNFYNRISFEYDNVLANIIPYSQLHHIDLKRYDVVINCAISYEYKTQTYNEAYDLDWLVGMKAAEAGCHYIMMSTRKVYGNSPIIARYSERHPLNPFDRYSENKCLTERFLTENLEDLTILRGSNIYGFELGRSSFVGYCMTQLKATGTIKYDMEKSIKRDFISIERVCELLKKICEIKPKGIYNLSSDFGLEISKIARGLILGYGQGNFIQQDTLAKEQFILDNTKLEDACNMKIRISNYSNDFYNMGRKLWMI